MRPPFKPEPAYSNFLRDGIEQTTLYMQPSCKDNLSDMLYGAGTFERAYHAQESYKRLLQLLCKLRVYKHIPQ